jgi:hypothetical protein
VLVPNPHLQAAASLGLQLARLSELHPHGNPVGDREGLLGQDAIKRLHPAETTAIKKTNLKELRITKS